MGTKPPRSKIGDASSDMRLDPTVSVIQTSEGRAGRRLEADLGNAAAALSRALASRAPAEPTVAPTPAASEVQAPCSELVQQALEIIEKLALTLPASLSPEHLKSFPPSELAMLGEGEMLEALCSDERADLLIGATVLKEEECLVVYRGDFSTARIPFEDFYTPETEPAPDFSRIAVADQGQTLKLGDYEISTSSILIAVDPEYRARVFARYSPVTTTHD